MNKFQNILISVLFFLFSCAPYVKYKDLAERKPQKSPEYNISIYHDLDPLPPQSNVIGKIIIDNAIPSMVNCGYNDAIRLAKWKTRKVGGDALQIIQINLPDESNSCYGKYD